MERIRMKDLPSVDRPYEKCLCFGPGVLSDAELLAVIIRTGSRDHSSLDLAGKLLALGSPGDGLLGLLHHSLNDFMKIKGVGKVKGIQLLCIGESLSNRSVTICSLDALLASLSEADRRALQPDLLITLGGHIVSNKMKQYLRNYPPRETWHLSPDPSVVDLFCSLTELITAPVEPFLETLAQGLAGQASSPYALQWRERIDRLPSPTPRYSSLAVVGKLLSHLPEEPCVLHLANSSSVRYAELFRKPRRLLTLCNRGTSGIEGSLSTALGFARQRAEERHFIVVGDLSFFYDLNALGLPEVGSNVRVLLLNNQRGSIFQSLPTLDMDSLSRRYITAEHQLRAQGWAESCGWEYLSVHEAGELEETMAYFVGPAERPRLLEAFVSSEDEIAELQTYFKQLQPREEL